VSFDRIVDKKIRDAMAEGMFDDLPGSGTPIDLDAYFQVPDHLRLAYSVLKSANCVPEEVELVNDVARLEARIAQATDRGTEMELRAELAAARLRLDIALERLRKR
jgi:hypothetical protein